MVEISVDLSLFNVRKYLVRFSDKNSVEKILLTLTKAFHLCLIDFAIKLLLDIFCRL